MHQLGQRILLCGVLALAACHDPDGDLDRRVTARLDREGVSPAAYTTTTRDRIVTLVGVVASPAERERLERAARDVDGVRGVDDRLVVQEPVTLTAGSGGEDPVDTLLRDTVQSRLAAHGLTDVTVDVAQRVVTLGGPVRADQRAPAVAIGREAVGRDGSVRDELVVVPR